MTRRFSRTLSASLLIPVILAIAWQAAAATTELITRSPAGAPANGISRWAGISDDGNIICFTSSASNLLAEGQDGNGVDDIFVYDRTTRAIRRVSVSTAGAEADGMSWDAEISGDGRWVAFHSDARNLIDDAPETLPTNFRDVYLRDLQTGTTIRVSAAIGGGEADGYAVLRSISRDGSLVSFSSTATNLVSTPNNGYEQAYLWRRATGAVELLSVSPTGEAANGWCSYSAVSSDGRYAAFKSEATNLIGDRFIQYYDELGYVHPNVFIRDLTAGTTRIVTVAPDGVTGSNDNSSWITRRWHGTLLVFGSYATNLIVPDTNGMGDLFAYDLGTGGLERISDSYIPGVQGNGTSTHSTVMSADNRYVCNTSSSDNLFPQDTNGVGDTVLWDFATRKYESINVDSSGLQGNGWGNWGAVNQDGRYVAFQSAADNLVQDDTNLVDDIFLRTRDLDRDADGYDETVDCNDTDSSIHPGAAEIKSDTIDQDCNGYDLTIDITKATWSRRNATLSVTATSALGAAAKLVLPDYGGTPLTWSKTKKTWSVVVSGVASNPGSVRVSGVEGEASAPVVTVK